MNPSRYHPGHHRQDTQAEGMYREFDATELYCPNCRQAVPVRKRLLLVLPEGDKYEYLCAYCSSSVGTKTDRSQKPPGLIL